MFSSSLAGVSNAGEEQQARTSGNLVVLALRVEGFPWQFA